MLSEKEMRYPLPCDILQADQGEAVCGRIKIDLVAAIGFRGTADTLRHLKTPGLTIAFADKVTHRSADVRFKALAGTTLGSAEAAWCKAAASHDADFQVGTVATFDTGAGSSGSKSDSRHFDRPYAQPPAVVVWLSGFELGIARSWRLSATASNIRTQGFVLNLDANGDTAPISASVC
jgi:hypothetical protein